MKYLLTLILLTSFIACQQAPEEAKNLSSTSEGNKLTLSDEQFKTIGVKTGPVVRQKMSSPVLATGSLDVPPQNLVTISPPIGGFVKKTELLQGMAVKKGQTIVTLEHPDYIQLQQDYLESKSQLDYLTLEYTRQQELSNENINSAKTLQQAKSNYQSTKAKTEGLAARLKLLNINPKVLEDGIIQSTIKITSPIEGYITEVNVNLGMYASPDLVMFKIVDSDHLHAEAYVFEKDITKVKVGQQMNLSLANETTSRTATVYLVGKEIAEDRTVRIHAHLTQEDPKLIPGMYFTATIDAGENTVNTVSENAVVSFEGKHFVFIERAKNTFELFPIEVGVTNNGFSEISTPKNWDSNTLVVTNGAYTLIGLLKNSG
jgi:cobalt-zinc-cadmium efflux system membrane fusion protein